MVSSSVALVVGGIVVGHGGGGLGREGDADARYLCIVVWIVGLRSSMGTCSRLYSAFERVRDVDAQKLHHM